MKTENQIGFNQIVIMKFLFRRVLEALLRGGNRKKRKHVETVCFELTTLVDVFPIPNGLFWNKTTCTAVTWF